MKCPLERKRFVGREWLFRRILHCLGTGTKGVVIVGEPGCGKTACCCEIIWPTRVDSLQQVLNGRLLAYYFCNAFDAASTSAGQFVLSLASQLLAGERPGRATMSGYRQRVMGEQKRKIWLQDPVKCECDPVEAFRRLVVEPLNEVQVLGAPSASGCSLFVMIDSLHDQCERGPSGAEGTISILDLWARFQDQLPPWLFTLCTSRKQCKCIAKKCLQFRKITLDDAQRPHIVEDIGAYIAHRLSDATAFKARSEQITTSEEELVNLLALKSNGCFLYLELILDAVQDSLISLDRANEVPGTLNGLYLWLCDKLIGDSPFCTVRDIFSVLLASRRPLSVKQLYRIVWTSNVDLSWSSFLAAVKRVSRLLWTDDKMCLLFHGSFAEWLLDVKHSTLKYLCRAVDGHGCLAMFLSCKASTLPKNELIQFAYHLSKLTSFGLSTEQLAMWMTTCGAKADGLILTHPVCDHETTRLLIELGASLVATKPPSNKQWPVSLAVPVQDENHAGHKSLHSSAQSGCSSCVRWWLSAARISPDIEDEYGNTALFLAAKFGHTEVCKHLLKVTQNVNAANRDGWTALRAAALGGHGTVLALLLRYGAGVDYCSADGRTALRAASWAGHEQCCSILLKAGASVDLQDCEGRTALMTAAFNGHFRVVEILAAAGANVDHRDRDGRTALIVVAMGPLPDKKRNAMIELLLKLSATVDITDKQGRSVLHFAALEGLVEVWDMLISRGADLNAEDEHNCTPLMLAACCGRRAIVDLLLSKGADVDTIDSTGRTVLSLAASQGNPDIVGALLLAGLDEMHRDNNGWVPLHYASCNGHLGACALLCSHHAETVDLNDNGGRTPLMLAVEEGHLDVAKCLLQFGASPFKPSLDGRTALHLASSSGSSELCYMLVSQSAGINVDVFDIEGRTSLYYAVLEEHADIVELLLSFGCDPSMADLHGRTPLHVASWLGNSFIAELLLRHGANVDAGDRENRTALMIAVWRNNYNVAKLLLQHKADPNAHCFEGSTALSIAAQEGKDTLVQLLLQFSADINHRDSRGRLAADIARLSNHDEIAHLLDTVQDNLVGMCTNLSGSSKKSAESKSSSGYQSLLMTNESLGSPKVDTSMEARPALDSISYASLSSEEDSPSSPALHQDVDPSVCAYSDHSGHSVHVALKAASNGSPVNREEDLSTSTIPDGDADLSQSLNLSSSCISCRESWHRTSKRTLIVTNPHYRRNVP
uniref:ANK_REP_REGION domain-containing protein n=1 Tax=Trichuris muris TaxID=70415 RepID=A0A5S6QMX6_TRIMR